mmetsp:Transcript_1335/g.3399  ORF Transcript_1335/g.3399 Transcript_1335/m.3399 type:complete len:348 (-) Transcript_1335:1724-2767(-)
MVLRFSRSRRGLCFAQFVVCAVFYAWTVLAFPSHSVWTTTICAANSLPRVQPPRKSAAKASINFRGGSRVAFFVNDGETAETETVTHAVDTSAATEVVWYEVEIRKFLASTLPAPTLLKQFEIQGWRWHTKSLQRDAGRLRRLASLTNIETVEILKDASEYVVGFNLKGLHKIEAPLFFPWMREKLTTSNPGKPELREAFSTAMDVLEKDREAVARLGERISGSVQIACNTQLPEASRSAAISDVVKHSEELQEVTKKMIHLEDSLLAPAIGAQVPTKEQKSFNNKVLRNLGILDSRLHLVGMYEVVEEGGDPMEKELFERAIPGLTRQLIPRWKRKLYEPKTHMLR